MAKATRSLKQYRAKRDFSRTSEPTGSTKTRNKARSTSKAGRKSATRTQRSSRTGQQKRKTRQPIFCVQKHLATRLHYDFRLEHNGVLLSWAVPKGPSLNPVDKRLAMHVEDHPLDYAEFEGVIPEGYGAGIVVLWDKGTWKPLDDDVDAAVRKGQIKFELDGVKLKGSWTLVRTSGRNGRSGSSREAASGSESGESWLLIKKRDHWSGNVDITTLAPKSIKSHGDFEDILRQEKPEIWNSHKVTAGSNLDASLKKIVQRLAKVRGSASTSNKATAKKKRRRA